MTDNNAAPTEMLLVEGVKAEKPLLVLDAGESAPVQPAAVMPELLAQAVLPALQPILARLEHLEQAITQLAAHVAQLVERTDLLPRQVRQLGAKVDDIIESVSQPRIRDLLGSLLLLHDLAEQMGLAAAGEAAGGQNYRVIRDQIAQTLRVNGVYLISEGQRFDPAFHKAVETVPCQTPDEDGEIVRVYRTGFRTERAILRYAEVVVRRYYHAPDHSTEVSNEHSLRH